MELDQDAIEIEKTGARLKALGFPEDTLRRCPHHIAGLRKALDEAAWSDGIFSAISDEVQRPSAEGIRLNTRAASAKLRWAVRA
jgi:16S rRNA C1402 N4-methylase RsmH